MSLTVKIKGDASHFEKTMAAVKKSGERVGKVFSTIAKGATYTATAVGALAVGAGALGFGLAKMAEEGEAAETRLQNIVKQMGLFKGQVGTVSDRLGDLADETARMTGVDDDAILATQAKLATFKELARSADVVGGAFDRATMAAIDMAAAGFGAAEQNAVQLGKALNDPINGLNALRRSGISFTESEREKIKALVESNQMLKAQEMILSAIETQVGGTAAATAKATDRIGVIFSQIGEKLGKPIADILDKLADGIAAKMPEINAVIAQVIRGDMTIFTKLGQVIGSAILAGMQAGIGGGFINSVARPAMEWLEGGNMGTPEAKAKAKATVTGYLGEEMSMGELVNTEELRTSIEDLKSSLPGGAAYYEREEKHRIEMLNLQRRLVDLQIQQGKDPTLKVSR